MPVDTLDPTWINAPAGVGPSYDSEELRRVQAFTIARGSTPGSARAGLLAVGDMELSLSGTNLRIGAGGCVVATAKGAYITGFASTTTVDALVPADVTNPRRDRVVVEILDPDNGGAAGRKGQARVIAGTPSATAASGGGYPSEPTGPVLTLGWVDVPKSGAGNPVITLNAPYTAAAGAAVPVRNLAEMNALPKQNGDQCIRLDLGGSVFNCNGSAWTTLPRLNVEIGQGNAVPVFKSLEVAVTLNTYLVGDIFFPTPFPTKLVSINLQRRHTTAGAVTFTIVSGSTDRTRAQFVASGVPAGSVIYVTYQAWGY